MEHHYERDPMVNPPPSMIDTTNSSNLRQHERGSPTPASTVVASKIGEECTNFDQTLDNSGVQKKTRKQTHMYDFGLKEATKDISAALGAAEDSRDRCHHEVLGLNKDMVRIEGRKWRWDSNLLLG
ncbi:hypothetical protein L7F22_025392 [Adiantum nelumboides]|nr:hypothetical protein [Adiantum nelumboides]